MTTQQQAWDAEAALREPDTTSASTNAATSTETPETPAATTQVEPPAGSTAATPDPLEELRKNFLALQQSNTELQQRLANTESVAKAAVGRVAAWQSEQDAARKAAAAAPAADAPSKAAIAAATTPEKWNTLKGEFPEWGEAIESFVESRLTNVPQGQPGITEEQIDAKLKSLPANNQSGLDIDTLKDIVESIIPGWEQKVNAPTYAPWIATQPPEVQALGASTKVSDAVKLVRLFEKHEASQAQAIEAQRQETLRIAAGGRPNAASRTDVDPGNLSPEALWNQEAAAREKKRGG